jgi:hypothetical protein
MATAARLHLLTARQIQAAGDGDQGDGGGLLLRIRGDSASWVFRYTAPTGRRREMGLGVVHRGSVAQAGASLTAARDLAHKARELLREGTDPLDVKAQRREAALAAEGAKKEAQARDRWTLARCARDHHERVIEPTRTTKHAAQWISSLENHTKLIRCNLGRGTNAGSRCMNSSGLITRCVVPSRRKRSRLSCATRGATAGQNSLQSRAPIDFALIPALSRHPVGLSQSGTQASSPGACDGR